MKRVHGLTSITFYMNIGEKSSHAHTQKNKKLFEKDKQQLFFYCVNKSELFSTP